MESIDSCHFPSRILTSWLAVCEWNDMTQSPESKIGNQKSQINQAPVAQLDRVSASEAEGCGFDPRQAQFRRDKS